MICCQAEACLISPYFVHKGCGNAKAGKLAAVRSLSRNKHRTSDEHPPAYNSFMLCEAYVASFCHKVLQISVFLTNRRSLEVEKLRINHEIGQEKLKRDNAIIEDVYQTLVSAHDLCVRLAYDVRNPRNNDLDTVCRIKEISSTTQRIIMLIRLHLSSLKEDLKEYEDNITAYWNELGNFYAARGSLNSSGGVLIQERLLKAESAYQKSLANIEAKLEKLVN